MEKFDLFRDIAERTGGDIYIGVVGPVRTGKSTFIKRFMETMVLPNIINPHDKERAKDELPQSAGGKTIMTTEPKFIPNEAVEINVKDNVNVRVRVVDCVGYTVDGALGYEEAEGPRMVLTPWFENEIPFQEAAEVGTRKVITEHSTIGLVITTDGTVTDLPRDKYIPAEDRVISELKELQKPFLVILNTGKPNSKDTRELVAKLEGTYDVPVIPVDCAQLSHDDIYGILQEVLYEFPVKEVNITLPKWVEELEKDYWLRQKFESAVSDVVQYIRRLRDIDRAIDDLSGYDFVADVILHDMDLGSGIAVIEMTARSDLFYSVLEELTGFTITGEHHLLRLMKDLAVAKRQYDKISAALEDVEQSGYGIVPPQLDEMVLEEPEIIRTGNRFGVKLKASAPSLHIIRTDVQAEISPIIGTEKQSEELIQYLMREFEGEPEKIWRTNLFGKSLNELVREGIQNKLTGMPENAQMKLKDTLQKIVNDGSGGLICIIF
ncbi:stage IV sporulation protein A [Sporomusa acidovorans]|uniref:Stage IV sporulation protein A n=1 Tax=Sporomusa acidovorans (strain ATCC 49682 / DSM 3132 / Mol) TaxID=1123286 RepID=A0ABZ3J348_SPOA4|nr:stage IV sporulation protein A [Sporomusa acidovorans]OZC20298.1 stage IV sporulation protein A [Sporomusa acidovorans DSM 3132]SDD38853.1 stage IV sporulation protein A [Sporomusa acidovorans]